MGIRGEDLGAGAPSAWGARTLATDQLQKIGPATNKPQTPVKREGHLYCLWTIQSSACKRCTLHGTQSPRALTAR